MRASKEDLLRARVGVHTYELDGVGEVEYRGLTRGEVLGLEGKKMSAAEADRKILALAVTDPKMTEAEWGEVAEVVPAMLLTPLVDKISEASGMRKEDVKETYAQFRHEQ